MIASASNSIFPDRTATAMRSSPSSLPFVVRLVLLVSWAWMIFGPGLAAAQPATIGPAGPVGDIPSGETRGDVIADSEPLPGSIALPVVMAGDGVIVRAEAGLDALASRVAGQAPAVLARIREDLVDLPAPAQVEIRLVKQARDLGAAAPRGRGAPEWASGVAYPRSGVVVVAARKDSEFIDVDSVVAHELSHLALGAALHGRAPRWLDEGFAFLHAPELSLDRVQILTGMVWFNNVIPLPELDSAFWQDKGVVDRAYAQSYDLAAFLARRGRHSHSDDDGNRWPFRRFLASLAAGQSLDDAAREAYAATARDLFEEWRGNLRDRYLIIPAGLFGAALWVVAALLLVLGFLRRRRINRRTLADWAEQEAGSSVDLPDLLN